MKKTLLLLLALATVAISCQKVDEKFDVKKYPNITASIAQDDTRISLNGTALQWTAGDLISITKDGRTAIYRALSSGATSEFEFESGEWGDGNGSMVAYFPSTLATTGFANAYTSQAGELTSLPLRAEIVDVDDNFTFRPFGGLLKFKVSKPAEETEEIKLGSISVTANEVIAGPFTDTTPSPATATATLNGTDKTITLTLAEPVALTSEAKEFYVPVPALTYTAGLTVKFSCNNCLKTVVTTSDLTVERSHIQPITVSVSTADQNEAIVKVSIDGGSTWMSFDNLNDAVDAIQGDKANCILELLKDCTIESQVRIGGKAFTWNGNGHTVTFTGNYPEITDNYQGGIHVFSSSDVDFTSTKFVGQGTSVTTTDRAFAIVASTASFGKDVTISDMKNSRPYGGAIWCNNASVLYLKDNVAIINCHNAPATSSYGGGAVCSDGTVYVQDDALISGCSSAFWGGAILSNYYNATSMLIMSGRACIENCTAGKAGGAFYGNGKIELSGEVKLSKCHAGTSGGAIECRKVLTISDKVLIENCDAVTGGGGIFANAATADVTLSDNVRITGCRALGESGGGIRSNYLAGKVTLKDNATIDHCSAISEGGAILVSGPFLMTGNAAIDSCSCSNGMGGAIRTWNTATIEGNAKISMCTAATVGGAIADTTAAANTAYGKLYIKENATITKCSATHGGAIHLAESAPVECYISDSANIYDNTATGKGNGIFVGSIMSATGGIVAANAASETIYVAAVGNLSISNGRFGNFGSGDIFLNDGGTAAVSGGYYNKPIEKVITIADGYKSASNPRSTDDDNKAFEGGYIYKVIPN